MNPYIIILSLIAIAVLLIGFSGRFSREHYIYSENEPIKNKKGKKSVYYMLENEGTTEEIFKNDFAPYHSSLENTINCLYDC